MDEIRAYEAKLIWNNANTLDVDGNTIEGALNETTLFKCSRKLSPANSKLTSSNLENDTSFTLASDIINTLDLSIDYRVEFEGVVYDVILIKFREFINDMIIYVR
jgi:hypothetical protein